MKTVYLDDDVYQHLLHNAEEIGESASSILRRLLHLDSGLTSEIPSTSPPNESRVGNGSSTGAGHDHVSHALTAFLASGDMLSARSALDRFLRILGFLHAQHPEDFGKVLQIRGRHRIYFGRNREDVDRSGSSVFPQQIPGSKYWVMTNSPTRQKREILTKVLKVLGYAPEVARRTAVALE
jgi:negative modulator of initiation of replication